jgi:hypothetical protein
VSYYDLFTTSTAYGLPLLSYVHPSCLRDVKPSVKTKCSRLFANSSGGSTIVCLFEKGALKWDDDLVENGKASIETLVRMGMGLGRSTGKVGI